MRQPRAGPDRADRTSEGMAAAGKRSSMNTATGNRELTTDHSRMGQEQE
jgi:hypothetical protein